MARFENTVSKIRNKLEEVIPLNTPYTISIDPSNLCNFKCNFCATHYSNEGSSIKKQTMSLELFKKIVDDIAEFDNKLKVLRITGNGEPLLNKELPKMIRYAKDKKIADFIEIFTNGSLLNKNLNKELIDSGVDRIRISIESLDEKGYEEIANVKINYKEFLSNIKDLYDNKKECEIYIKTVDAAIKNDNDKEKFIKLFDDKCDRIFIDKIIPLWAGFDEIKFDARDGKGVHGQKITNINVCPFIFYSFVINSNGEVTCCCADWKRKIVIGDANTESIKNIWNGKRLREFWKIMLKGKKDQIEVCKKCYYPIFDCNDNIDEFASEIYNKIYKN